MTVSDYQGVALKDETFTVGARLDYKLTRSVVLRASFTHERLKSTDHSSDYSANTYLVGLRFHSGRYRPSNFVNSSRNGAASSARSKA